MNKVEIVVRGPSNARKSTIIRVCADALVQAGLKDVIASDYEALHMRSEKIASLLHADLQVHLHEERVSTLSPQKKQCGVCGTIYTELAWGRLKHIGDQIDEVEVIELRNCVCGSTLGVTKEYPSAVGAV